MLWLLLLQVWVSCLWLGHSEVVPSFDSCLQFFYENTPPDNALKPENPAWICQKYKNKTHFATLYDKTRHIPMYSAYIYEPGSGRPTPTWMLEPQLINKTCSSNMETVSTIRKDCSSNDSAINESQAVNTDYDNLKDLELERGHLNPSGHHNNQDNQTATFTLTNVVPQNSSLNKGAWKSYEQSTMKKKSENCTQTYVIVGAVPGNTSVPNGRVNVPSHIWASACCKMKNNSMSAWAVIAENNKNKVQNRTLEQLEMQLSELYNRGNVSLFRSDCPRK